MKRTLLFVMAMAIYITHAQNVGIGTKNPQNKLHIAGGLRIDSLANKKDSGLILHNNVGDVYSLKLTGKKSDVLHGDGTFSSAAAASITAAWLLDGNAGTDSNTNFVGTTDNRPLRFRINNEWFGSLGPNVSLGLNSNGSKTMDSSGAGTTPGDNVAIGNWALADNTTGNHNVAIGTESQQKLFSGNRNTSVGYRANKGFFDTFFPNNGSGNTAVGANALQFAAFTDDNTAVGVDAMASNKYSPFNTAVGQKALYSLGSTLPEEVPAGNVALGAYSLSSTVRGAYNTAVGYRSMYASEGASYATAVGHQALASDNGWANTAVGAWALQTNTSGYYNSALGQYALYSNSTGYYNSAFGSGTLTSNRTGSYNTAVGSSSLFNSFDASYNSGFGYAALHANNRGKHNTAIGALALRNTASDQNSALGSNALFRNSTGINNTAVGYLTLFNNQTGHANTAAGTRSLGSNISGVNNTAVGYGALLTNTTGSLNTALGMTADVTSASLVNATAIGYGAKVNASNKVRIGNAAVTKIEGQVPFTTPSDGRYKFNVKEDVKGLEFIMKLRPVTYQFDVRRFDHASSNSKISSAAQVGYGAAEQIRRTGFIAQEVEKAAIATNYNFSGIDRPASSADHYSLSYESFVVPLVKAVQEQQLIIKEQQFINDRQQREIKQAHLLIKDLKRQMEKLIHRVALLEKTN